MEEVMPILQMRELLSGGSHSMLCATHSKANCNNINSGFHDLIASMCQSLYQELIFINLFNSYFNFVKYVLFVSILQIKKVRLRVNCPR